MRPSWVEVDLDAIHHNVNRFRDVVAPAEVVSVVKANAYGHGDVEVATTALQAGASWLAVALTEEAIRLREAGIDAPILLLSEPPVTDVGDIRRWKITPSVYHREFIEALAEEQDPLGVHLVVDTGMHRVGARPEDTLELARMVDASPALRLEGVWTHFAVAEHDDEFTGLQSSRLDEVVSVIRDAGMDPGLVHRANSAGALYIRAEGAMARIGLGMYGIHPDPSRRVTELRPAMRVVSHVSHVRRHPAGTRPSYGRRIPLAADANVATIPIGYADGVPRIISLRGGSVLIGGSRRPFAGVITMDQIMVDCGDDPVSVGDEVVLIGRQGSEEIDVDEWARLAETISWEILCGIGDRLPRRYLPVQSSS